METAEIFLDMVKFRDRLWAAWQIMLEGRDEGLQIGHENIQALISQALEAGMKRAVIQRELSKITGGLSDQEGFSLRDVY